MPVTTRLLSPEARCASYEFHLQSPSTSNRGSYLQSSHYTVTKQNFVKSSPANTQTNTVSSLESPLKSKVQTKISSTSTPLQKEASLKPANECVLRDGQWVETLPCISHHPNPSTRRTQTDYRGHQRW
ncbi:hypothetical protein BDR07DRAFT_676640 [Suillus spraguei]|nr:hypothetical protein BDR07DRAFT_688586 [Suillus spraguei]KAG2353862.1 hypothetical protein BDR07DRAFT_676640 [Suillus spraguei]